MAIRGLELAIPDPPKGNDPEDIVQWVLDAISEIELSLNNYAFIQLKELNVVPDKPRDGLVIFADGTNFNPGSGRGAYLYSNGAWRFLG